eukprot:CAMPEP_0182568014 /NCGR_PEP_ID=MMETSP1324-20130603/9079_1 /TAXON_ID=236786 /ORGANISM="Florenciella sp., Strain RCC1587" /LENGTH=113 /DNA_ID=CAMNT_0024782105 /DNA_START=544 /DNA_END=886 /DNA_ORIENTATION=-
MTRRADDRETGRVANVRLAKPSSSPSSPLPLKIMPAPGLPARVHGHAHGAAQPVPLPLPLPLPAATAATTTSHPLSADYSASTASTRYASSLLIVIRQSGETGLHCGIIGGII